MNNNSIATDNQNNFDNNLEFLKNAIDLRKYEIDTQSIDLDSNDLIFANAIPNSLNTSESVIIKTHWWGIDIILNNKLTTDIIDGTAATGTVTTAIVAALGVAGLLTGGAATIMGGAVAAAFALKTAELKIVNNGKGVHFPVTWPQWGTLLVALPAGVAGIIAALLLFIHPLRN